MRRLTLLATLAYFELTALPGRLATRLSDLDESRRADGRDRGDALTTAVITVGLVLIAAVVLIILRTKAEQTAENVCTNADPTTCVQQ